MNNLIKRLICKWKFSRLSKKDQEIFRFFGVDPQSLIDRGEI